MSKINLLLFLIFLVINLLSFGQENESTAPKIHVSGSASLTNNGISLIPNFSLGEPAALFNLSVAKGKLGFDTDFNFSMKGKPWYILYWLRYQVVNNERFQMGAATHLGLNFRPSYMEINSKPENMLTTERYWVVDLFPRYMLSKNTSVGIYYLHSVGLDPGTVGSTNFVTLNATFSHLQLYKDFYLGVNPQLYYLKQDKPDGFYFTSTFNLSKDNCPLSISSLINKEIKTGITAGENFVWNICLKYSF